VRFTRNFWTHLDVALSEPVGKFFCNPPLRFSCRKFFFECFMAAFFFPCAIFGFFVCFIQELFFTTKFYSSIVDEEISNTRKSEDFENFEFTLLTNNTCLMPEFLSRKNNQPFAIKRAGRIAQSLITKPEKAPTQNIDVNLPENIDIICLQEVFDESSWEILNDTLKAFYPYILYDPFKMFLRWNHFCVINSGLYIASKYPIIRSEFFTFSDAYFEDAACSRGLLIAEIDIQNNRSIIVGTTHLQAPGRDRLFPESHFQHLKSSKIRQKSLDEMHKFLTIFKSNSLQTVAIEIICGDLNTDKYSNFDQRNCFGSKIFREMQDATAEISHGSTFVIENNRDPEVSTPLSLKKTLEARNPKFVLSSDNETSKGTIESSQNGKVLFDYILYRSENQTNHVTRMHTTLASMTDHVPISAQFKLQF